MEAAVGDFFAAVQSHDFDRLEKILLHSAPLNQERKAALSAIAGDIKTWKVKNIDHRGGASYVDVVISKDGRDVIMTFVLVKKGKAILIKDDIRVKQFYDIIPAQKEKMSETQALETS
ncbi:hypothetical protein [Sediminispirochaeta bajacaliforniensis]|uniref:hypothetical protein n=1 Tax=Sediminispirochaeta bajacaliforniensis TaxID=148 RepID=UPI0012B56BB2|nr:hypothetical protein [Sediminispirochaeta bajacaliforniensis]